MDIRRLIPRSLLALTLFSSASFAAVNTADQDFTDPSALENERELGFDELMRNPQNLENAGDAESMAKELWNLYRQKALSDGDRTSAHASRKLKDGNKSMRFSFSLKGEKPSRGYPLYIALHGGGGTAPSVNDSQWEHMKSYYLDGMKTGIYVATRGVTDTWNLHFVEESYRLYDALIENMIALEGVDPNRVYILGFSAGGDGVYQIAPRMADRWAAANMSAGHHNWIKFDNLYQTPFLMQMGQQDGAYKRNTVAVENSIELKRLQALRGGYPHDLFLHYRGSHNSWSDRDPSGREQTILADPIAWLKDKKEDTRKRNTNAINWLERNTRQPYPSKIYWDPNTGAVRNINRNAAYLSDPAQRLALAQPKELFYWLDISQATQIPRDFLIEAAYSRDDNAIHLKGLSTLDAIRVLLRPEMLDISKAISVFVDGQLVGVAQVQANSKTMARTLLERGDSSYIFHSEINLVQDQDGEWTLRP